MMRKCHLNTCPVGVATQDPELRKKFSGKPEHVVNFFFFIAEEVREIMAQLGMRKFDELIGRVDLLDTRKGVDHWKAQGLDFSKVFALPDVPAKEPRHQTLTQDHGLGSALDHILMEKSEPALERGEKVSFIVPIRNVNRTAGAMLSGEVAMRYGHTGLPNDTIHIQLNGTAGQSFAAFLAHGITFDLVGDANDYVGKGLSGGRVIVRRRVDYAVANQVAALTLDNTLANLFSGQLKADVGLARAAVPLAVFDKRASRIGRDAAVADGVPTNAEGLA